MTEPAPGATPEPAATDDNAAQDDLVSAARDVLGQDQLGDAGKRALDRMKQERNDSQRALREWTQLAQELGMESPTELKEKFSSMNQTTDEPEVDVEKAINDAVTRVRQEEGDKRLRAEINATAQNRLANPELASALLDKQNIKLDDEGNPSGVTEAFDNLLKTYPYLGVQDSRRFQGSADGGPRNGNTPSQVSREDIKNMTPEQINKARADGLLNDLLAGR